MFIPWLIAVLVWVAFDHPFTWRRGAVLLLAGVFVWTLIEWLVHRSMHLRVRSVAVSRFQDEAHLRHHREPHDVEHSVVMLRVSIPLAAIFLAIAIVICRDIPTALMCHAGLMLGYLTYEFVHLATHARWRIPALAYLTRYHNLHHFRRWDRTFGVTTPLWDWVFGTLPKARSFLSSAGLPLPGRRAGTGADRPGRDEPLARRAR